MKYRSSLKVFAPAFILFFVLSSCQSQINSSVPEKIIGGPCEGCEALYEYGNKNLLHIDTLPGFESTEPKLKISGTVFQKDAKTPAQNVILYIYHTDRDGLYPIKENESAWAARHGFIRGWIKTDHQGRYEFYTFRPAAYPNGREPEHIHITIKEPGKNAYYLDEFVFDDDPLLTPSIRTALPNRGGSGICKLEKREAWLYTERDIILGLNIPNYK